MVDVTKDVLAILASKINGDHKVIELTDRLDELGLESIAAIEMIFDLEEKFNIEIPYNANDSRPDFRTAGDVVRAVQEVVARAK